MGSIGAKPGQRGIVGAHRIALVIREAVAGITGIEFSHQRIARHLRENGSRRDAGRFCVTLDNRLLRDGDLFQTFASIKRCCGVDRNPSTARRIARMPAQ